MSLKVDIHKKYKSFSLNVKFESQGEILGILGASGSGKSLTLKCISGILTPDEGYISLNGKVLFDSAAKLNIKPQQRKVGYLFQDYALFPHMTVKENIVCTLSGKKHEKQETAEKLLAHFELSKYSNHYPSQLSGGQQQRVALARILAYEPQALLLDEPFSALDMHMREKIQVEMMQLLKESYFGEVIMVTHSRDEVYRLTKKLMVIDNGYVLEMDNTKKLFFHPRNHVTARLTGCKNISNAKKIDETHVYAKDWDIVLNTNCVPEKLTHIGIRAHDFHPSTSQNDTNRIKPKFLNSMENPFEWSVMFKNAHAQNNHEIWWMYNKELKIDKMPEYIFIKPENIILLEK